MLCILCARSDIDNSLAEKNSFCLFLPAQRSNQSGQHVFFFDQSEAKTSPSSDFRWFFPRFTFSCRSQHQAPVALDRIQLSMTFVCIIISLEFPTTRFCSRSHTVSRFRIIWPRHTQIHTHCNDFRFFY